MGKLSSTFPTAESVDAALKRANRAEVNVASLYGEVLNKVDNADFNEKTQDLQNQINNIISPVTQDAEVQNARVGYDSTSYSTLKNRLDSEYNILSESISATNEDVDEKIANITEIIGKTISSFTVGTSQHSSRSDMIPWNGKAGDTIYISVSSSPALSPQRNGGVYTYLNDIGTEYGSILIDGTTPKAVTLLNDVDYIGIWIPALDEECEITVAVESEDSISSRIDMLNNYAEDVSIFKSNVGYYSIRYALTSSHSSSVDRVNIDNLKKGSIVTISASNDGGVAGNVGIFAKKGSAEGILICEIPFGKSKTIVLDDEYDSFGAYSTTPDATGYATIGFEIQQPERVYNPIDYFANVKNGTMWQGKEASSTTRCLTSEIDINIIDAVVASDDFKFYVAYFNDIGEMISDSGWYSITKQYDIDKSIEASTVRIGVAFVDDSAITVDDAVSNVFIRTSSYDSVNYRLTEHINTFNQLFKVFTKFDIVRGSWNADGERVSSATRLTSRVKIPCLYGSYIEFDAKDLYIAIDVWDETGNSIVSSSGWCSGRNRFYLKGNYFTYYIANGATWSTSTDIFLDDYNCELFYFKSAPYVTPPEKQLGDPSEYGMGFANLLKDIGKSDSFLFFTDPHIVFKSGWEDRLADCLNYVKTIQDVTPISFVLNGGDWLGNGNTQSEAAYMLSQISAKMHKYFGDDYVMLVGNHDTNYQGVISEDNNNNGIFTHEVMDNLYNAKYRKSYFVYKAPTFDLYCFDSWTGKSTTLSAYSKAQVEWFASALMTNQTERIAIGLHIIEDNIDYGAKIIDSLANELSLISKAFNSRTTYTIDGTTYDYSNSVGKVSFMIGGHYHADGNGVINGIPYVLTTNAGDGGGYTGFPLDLCAADWDNGKLYLYRCDLTKPSTTRMINIVI